MMGSSNIKGYLYSLISEADPSLQGTIPGVEIWTGSAWETLEAGVNNDGETVNNFGAEMSFARDIAGRNGQTQYIIKHAVSGSHLYYPLYGLSWLPLANEIYPVFRSKILAAATALAESGVIPILQAYIIHLGGNDRNTEASASQVGENLATLMTASLAADIGIGLQGAPNIVVSSLVDYAGGGGIYKTLVENGLSEFVASRADATEVSLAGLPVTPIDGVHYIASSSEGFGERLATEIINIT